MYRLPNLGIVSSLFHRRVAWCPAVSCDHILNARVTIGQWRLSKIFTAVINDRLTEYLDANGKLSETQSGFRNGYSITDNIFVSLMCNRFILVVVRFCNSYSTHTCYVLDSLIHFQLAFSFRCIYLSIQETRCDCICSVHVCSPLKPVNTVLFTQTDARTATWVPQIHFLYLICLFQLFSVSYQRIDC